MISNQLAATMIPPTLRSAAPPESSEIGAARLTGSRLNANDNLIMEHQSPTLLEIALQRGHRLTLAALTAITLASWTWIVVMARDMYGTMMGPSAWMMTTVWDWPRTVLLWAMWAAMMMAMMLPSAAPLILLYAAAARRHAEPGSPARRVYALAAGYVLVWSLFSVLATALQRVLSSTLVLTPMMEPATPLAGGVVLAIAAAYQFTPLKRACLRQCRSPLGFMMQTWRGGAAGAFHLGVRHGTYCLGCCWALMLILFAGGVMNLAVIVALTTWVMVEKLAPFGERTPTISGAVLLLVAGWMIVRGVS
jgi:predicted metal-binding membrane protein